jgi:hypothetical protein
MPERYRNRIFYDALNEGELAEARQGKFVHAIWPNWEFVLVSN